MALTADQQTAITGLDLLLAETPASAYEIEALRDKAYQFLSIVRPAFINGHNGEWDQLAARVHDRFGPMALVEPEPVLVPDVAPAFQRIDAFEDIVCDDFFGDYLRYTADSEAPAQFHFGAMLTCASAAFARKPLLGWHAAPLYPNIYTILVGPSGTRKSAALNKAKELVRLAFPKVGTVASRINILPNEGSPQGYAMALRNRSYENTPPMSDGLLVASELTVLIGRDSYKDAMGTWLTDWYDNFESPWSRVLKGEGIYELPNPYVCFAGASNMTWLKDIPEKLIKAGYMPRHLVFQATEKRHDRSNPQFDLVLRDRLIARLVEATANIPETMPLSVEAAMLLDEWYLGKVTRQERGEVDDQFALWLSRKLPHALKVAVVWQVVDGGPTDSLRAAWLNRAIRLVDWMDAGVMAVYSALGSTGEGAATNAVLAYVERKGGAVSMATLIRGLKNKYNSRSVIESIKTLSLARLVTVMNEQAGTMVRMTEVARGGR